MTMTFPPAQAKLIGDCMAMWADYYSDGGVLEPCNLHSSDMTLEDAKREQEAAARFAWDGKTLEFIPGSALLGDICHELDIIAVDINSDPARRRAAHIALAKLSQHDTF